MGFEKTGFDLQADQARPDKNGIISVCDLQLQLQSFKPINRIHCHLCAFHFDVYDMSRQVEAHHYCMHYNQDMRQCAIFDSRMRHLR